MEQRAYIKLYAIANNALQTAEALNYSSGHSLFTPEQLYAIALDYAIAALEAYINYLGYIFVDSWAVLQKKHFWGQYEQVRETLAKLQINLPEEPLPQYRALRSKRNHLHHVHSVLDKRQVANSYEISAKDAEAAVTGVGQFIDDLLATFKNGLASYDNFEAVWLKISQDNQLKERKLLYHQFIDRN